MELIYLLSGFSYSLFSQVLGQNVGFHILWILIQIFNKVIFHQIIAVIDIDFTLIWILLFNLIEKILSKLNIKQLPRTDS